MKDATVPAVAAIRRRGAMAAVGIVLGLGAAHAAAEPVAPAPSAPEAIVELPKFYVTDVRELPPPEPWRYTTLPGFEIISSASDRATQRLLRDFALFREALRIVWPLPETMDNPVLLILCGKDRQFAAFLPPRSTGTPDVARASVFLKGRSRDAIVINMGSPVINLLSLEGDDPASGEDLSHFSVDYNKQLYREYVRYMLSRSQPEPPAWFEEGMAQIVMAMKFDPKFIEFGKVEEGNTVSAAAGALARMNQMAAASSGAAEFDGPPAATAPAEDRDFNNALSHRALMPMRDLLAVPHEAPEAQNPLGNNRWAKQCYAFVHLGLFGENHRYQKAFTQFLIRSSREPATEAMFKECFGMSYRDMNIVLRGYIEYTNYRSKEYRIKQGQLPVPASIPLRDATESEVGRIKGQALLMAGHPNAAKNEFIAPYVRGERDPQLLAALGAAEHTAGHDDRARKFLLAAVAGKTSDPNAYVELARFRYADAVASPAGGNGHFSEAQAADIASLLLTARTLPPPDVATYELLADTLANRVTPPTPAEVAPLLQGVQLFANHLRLVYLTAVLCADAKLTEPAQSLVEHGLKYSPEGPGKKAFQTLQASLPAVPAASKAGK